MIPRISLSASEHSGRQLDERNIARALNAIREQGIVVIEQAVSHDPLSILSRRMDADTTRLVAFQDEHGGNPRAEGHLQQGPPVTGEFVFADVIGNPFAVQLSKALLGNGAYLGFYNGNTNYPGSCYQAVHMDNPHLWPEAETASPAYSLVVNVPLGDCTTANGAVEIWPGTHRVMCRVDHNNINPADVEARRNIAPPLQAETRRGDIVVRDTRLWHRGVPNPSSKPRHMIASIHAAPWLKRNRTLQFHTSAEATISAINFDCNAEFVDGEIDYLFGPTREIYERKGLWRDDKGSASKENEGR